jgi:hypothetical protein
MTAAAGGPAYNPAFRVGKRGYQGSNLPEV